MTENGKMILKILVLILPAIVLYFTLYGGQKGGGIGGGGYDLSELVYGGIFILFVFCWNIWVLASLLMAKTAGDKLNNKILLIMGVLALVATAFWYLKQLR